MRSVATGLTERYRALFDAAPSALIVTDPHLTILEANPAASELLEVELRFLPGKPLATFFETGERRELRTWPGRIAHAGGRRAASMRMHRRSGVTFDAGVTVTTGHGELYWTIVDRTEETQAETRLWELNRELEERVAEPSAELRALADELPVGVVVVSVSGEVAWMNRPASALLAGRTLADTPLAAVGNRAVRGESVRDLRVEIDSSNSAPLTLRVTAAPVTSSRGGVVLVLDDVSERARIERADAEFVENAAHQLRTPITAIASSVAALEAGAKDDPVDRDRFIAHVGRESERMGRLVESLLTLAGLQRGTGRTIVELVPLRPLIDDALATVELRDGVRAVVACGEHLAVVGDRELFAEALRNVISNAAQHTASGEIRIQAEEEEEEEEEGHNYGKVRVVIADTGDGVPAEVRDRIFDRFYRASKDGRRGSGLGLAIALAAAQATRSSLELLEPADGLGATFRFTMPGAKLL